MVRRVLVAEDSRVTNDLLCELLTEAGYDCTQAFDGVSALEAFAAVDPQALVLDLDLPKLHGLDVLRQVKELNPHTTVIILTGHGSEQAAIRALRLGADDYLSKPVRGGRLLEALQKSFDRAEREKRAEWLGALRAQVPESYLARVFFDAPAPILYADSGGVVRAVNQAAARMVGHRPDELLGCPVGELINGDSGAQWLEAVRREASTARGYEGEVLLNAGPGDPVPVGVSALEKPDQGGLLLCFRDLRRQKALEEQYFESKKLASLGRVVEGVAHEVRNPLISIGGFARKLRREVPSETKQAQFLDVILSEVLRLEKMVMDIESYVQFTSYHRPCFLGVELVGLIRDTLEAVTGRFSGWEGRTAFDPPESLPTIFGDPALLRELFDGLLENAYDAMPKGGDLSILFENTGSWVRVRIVDTGVGIPEKDLGEIFDPFFTSKTSGAGLGLAKAYMIVEEHSGTIEFESQVGKGTVCTVSLPIDRRKVPRAPA